MLVNMFHNLQVTQSTKPVPAGNWQAQSIVLASGCMCMCLYLSVNRGWEGAEPISVVKMSFSAHFRVPVV